MFEWCFSGVLVVFLWCFSGVLVVGIILVVVWLCLGGVFMVFQ